MKKVLKAILAASAMLLAVPGASAEQLIAHVCWMGSECVDEYLISSKPLKGRSIKVRVRSVLSVDGSAGESTQRDLVISCKKKPLNDHANAVEYTRWMHVCKGEKTEWSPEVSLR